MRGQLSAFLALALLWLSPHPAGAQDFSVPTPTSKTLANGLIVDVFESDDLPTVHIRLLIKSGASGEEMEKAGLASLTAQTLFRKENDPASPGRLADLGGSLNANSTHDYSLVSARVLRDDWQEALGIIGEGVVAAEVDEAALNSARDVMLQGMRRMEDDPGFVADNHFRAMVYGFSPYGRPVQGIKRTLDPLTTEDVTAFYRSHWRPNNAVLVVAGNVESEAVFAAAERVFGSWERADIPARPRGGIPTYSENEIRILNRPNLPVCELRIGYAGPGIYSKDYFAIQVMNAVVGGARPSSRLARAVRARWGDGVSVGAEWWFGMDGGSFLFSSAAPAVDIRSLIETSFDVIREYRESGPTAEELQEAKDFLIGASLFAFETPGSTADRWLSLRLYSLTDDYLQNYDTRISEITQEDATRAAQGYLRDHRLVMTVVGDQRSLMLQLSPFGEIDAMPFAAHTGVITVAPRVRADSSPEFSVESREKARGVVKRAMSAHGGSERINGVTSMQLSGSIEMSISGPAVSGEFAEVVQLPDRHRVDMIIEGTRITRSVMGGVGWVSNQGQVTDMDPLEIESMKPSAYTNALLLLAHLGVENADVLYVGRETRDSLEVEVIEWVDQEGSPARVYFDAETLILTALEQTEIAPGTDQEVTVLRLFEDMRNVGHILYPHRVTLFMNGKQAMLQNVAELDFDANLTEEVFRRPLQ